jgi:hypothetical protein
VSGLQPPPRRNRAGVCAWALHLFCMGAQFWWIGSRFTDRRENMTAATLLGCTNRPKSRVA